MAERNVDWRAGAADLHRRRHDSLGLAKPLAHGIAARHMPQRGVFQLAAFSGEGRLAIAVDPVHPAKRGDQLVGHLQSKRLQIVHRRLQVFLPGAGKRVGDNCHNSGTAARCGRWRSVLVMDGLGKQHHLAKPEVRHRSVLFIHGSVGKFLRIDQGRGRIIEPDDGDPALKLQHRACNLSALHHMPCQITPSG